jgi:uncharacterized protein YacL
MKTTNATVSCVGAIIMHVLAGILVVVIGRSLSMRFIEMEEVVLPTLTRLAFGYSTSSVPIVLAAVVGVVFGLSIALVMRLGGARRYARILMAVSLAIAVLHVLIVWICISSPTLLEV